MQRPAVGSTGYMGSISAVVCRNAPCDTLATVAGQPSSRTLGLRRFFKQVAPAAFQAMQQTSSADVEVTIAGWERSGSRVAAPPVRATTPLSTRRSPPARPSPPLVHRVKILEQKVERLTRELAAIKRVAGTSARGDLLSDRQAPPDQRGVEYWRGALMPLRPADQLELVWNELDEATKQRPAAAIYRSLTALTSGVITRDKDGIVTFAGRAPTTRSKSQATKMIKDLRSRHRA